MGKHSNSNNHTKAISLLALAALVFFLLPRLPFGNAIQWPFVIVTTFVHELGHGLMAIAVGGDFLKMEIYRNASGLAFTQGATPGLLLALIAAAGLIAPAVCAGLFILAGRSESNSSRLLIVFSVVILLSCAFWVRTAFGLIVLVTFAAFFLFLSQKAKGAFDQFAVQFMGVHMLVDTIDRSMSYAFKSSANVAGQLRSSDTGVIAENLGGSYFFWAIIIALLSLMILAVSLKRAYFRSHT